jgi:hypothetical protein
MSLSALYHIPLCIAFGKVPVCSEFRVPQQCKSYYSEKGFQCQQLFIEKLKYFSIGLDNSPQRPYLSLFSAI